MGAHSTQAVPVAAERRSVQRPANAAPHSALLPSAREELDRIYKAPNRALFDLTGIDFGRTNVHPAEVSGSYMDVYRTHTDARVLDDPHKAIGGMWNQIGRLQFEYFVKDGLHPHHTMLDIGCGTLRGGRHFIAYLESGRYTGIDISSNALAESARLVEREGLSRKQPLLLLDGDMKPGFEEFKSSFDFLLAQSVFTHLPKERIVEFFANVGRIMQTASRFHFIYFPWSRPAQPGTENFRYPFTFFAALADQYGFALELRHDYMHPRGQLMIVMKIRYQASRCSKSGQGSLL